LNVFLPRFKCGKNCFTIIFFKSTHWSIYVSVWLNVRWYKVGFSVRGTFGVQIWYIWIVNASKLAPALELDEEVAMNGSKFFLFEINKKQIFLFVLTLNPSLLCQNQKQIEKTGDESETAENVEDMVYTTTISGIVITNWRVSKYR
jgi:hypothetical protein